MKGINLKREMVVQALMDQRQSEVRSFILRHLEEHPRDIARLTSRRFKISRMAVGRHLRNLVTDGILTATGLTKDREYALAKLLDEAFRIQITPGMSESDIWHERVSPLLKGIPENIFLICSWGFTEMLNNVIDHSESPNAVIQIILTATSIELAVGDHGVGIFNKIQQRFGYQDPRHALLELTKGKLTTDKEHHTGYGIFFTSRAFDKFSISSGGLFFLRRNDGDEWFIETHDQKPLEGTYIRMKISLAARHTLQQIFDRYTGDFDGGFTKTHVPLVLAKYEGEQLISRSQARRVLARFDQFKEVFLDFQGITVIGQGFADEIFRVFAKSNPDVQIVYVGATEEVKKMIKLAKAGMKQDQKDNKQLNA